MLSCETAGQSVEWEGVEQDVQLMIPQEDHCRWSQVHRSRSIRCARINSPAIEVVQQTLRGHGLEVQSGPMSTYVVGEANSIFAALREAFVAAAATGHVVMTVTVSNASPVND